MRSQTIIVFALMFLSGLPQTTAAQSPEQLKQSDSIPITSVIEGFWTALGSLNGEAMKQTLDWPVSIVEASPSETKNPHVIASPQEFDKEFSRHRPVSGKSEFYGTKLSDFKVQMLNHSLALVTYTAKLPASIAATRESDFNAVAVLRKIPKEDQWKIMFVSVPK